MLAFAEWPTTAVSSTTTLRTTVARTGSSIKFLVIFATCFRLIFRATITIRFTVAICPTLTFLVAFACAIGQKLRTALTIYPTRAFIVAIAPAVATSTTLFRILQVFTALTICTTYTVGTTAAIIEAGRAVGISAVVCLLAPFLIFTARAYITAKTYFATRTAI